MKNWRSSLVCIYFLDILHRNCIHLAINIALLKLQKEVLAITKTHVVLNIWGLKTPNFTDIFYYSDIKNK